MKTLFQFITAALLLFPQSAHCWGFYAHRKINYYAVFLLPPDMMVLYKPNQAFLSEHAPDPDKRRYVLKSEGPRHFIDIDHYGAYPYSNLPRRWKDAVAKFGEDTLNTYGIAPWNLLATEQKLTVAFREKNFSKILKYSADLGHYMADIHVPLHASSNHNGQLTHQEGIHAFWESRIPELLAEKEFDFFIGKANYIEAPEDFVWARVLESAQEADSVLAIEKTLSQEFPTDKKYAFEERNGKIVKQYAAAYTIAYNKRLNGMVERRMRQAIYAVASFWYTAWINAGQPALKSLAGEQLSAQDTKELEELDKQWKTSSSMIGRQED